MTTVFQIANSIITIYMLMMFIRILLSWFGGMQTMGRPAEILASLTDPYLNLFRGLRFLRIGPFDFSPIVALLILSLVSSVLSQLAMQQQVTVGLLLALIVMMVLSAVSFFALIFLVLAIIRVVGILTGLGAGGRLMMILDSIFQPLSFRLAARLFAGRSVTYTTTLFTMIAILGAVTVGGQILSPLLADLLLRLPF